MGTPVRQAQRHSRMPGREATIPLPKPLQKISTYKISLDLIKKILIICPMDTFTALSDPTRRQIIESLAVGETPFGELADKFEMSRPAVSQHLKVLRDVGIVTARVDAQRRIYRLNENCLDEVESWLGKVREFWSQRLDKLEELLGEAD